MKKLLNILEAIILITYGSNSVISCYGGGKLKTNKRSEKTNQLVVNTPNITQSKTEISKKVIYQQFADEVVNIINNNIYIYKIKDTINENEIKNYFITLIPNIINIKNLNTSEFDKTKIKFENIDSIYIHLEKELKNIVVKYDNIESKTKINLIIIKKEEKELNKMLNYNFGEIKLKNNIPTKTELVNYIKINNSNFEKITEDDFEILENTLTNAVIIGKGEYIGSIKLFYKRKLINLNNNLIGNSQNISLNSIFFKKQNIDVSSIQQSCVKKLVINYLIKRYTNLGIQLVLPDINLENDIEIDFKDNIFPFDLKEKKEINFGIFGINNAIGKIDIKITYLN